MVVAVDAEYIGLDQSRPPPTSVVVAALLKLSYLIVGYLMRNSQASYLLPPARPMIMNHAFNIAKLGMLTIEWLELCLSLTLLLILTHQ